jgi:hypothetical protein
MRLKIYSNPKMFLGAIGTLAIVAKLKSGSVNPGAAILMRCFHRIVFLELDPTWKLRPPGGGSVIE